ncbi:MAG: hypothetical protein ABIF11_09430 [Nitrospirota bacterium]
MAGAVQYAEFLSDGHLFLPTETIRELSLTQGTKLELFSNQKDVIVLKKVEDIWKKHFEETLNRVRMRNRRFSEEEIISDVNKAVEDVRKERYEKRV